MKMSYLMSFLAFLSFTGCRYPMPEAPIVERCIINLDTGREICFDYKIDVFGGFSDPLTEVRRPISDRSVCFPIDEWVEIALWRDELVQWSEDIRGNR